MDKGMNRRAPQVASMCEQIVARLNEQEKLLAILREKLAPILSPTPKGEEAANKVDNAVVPLAEGLRDIARKIGIHNGVIDSLIGGIEI